MEQATVDSRERDQWATGTDTHHMVNIGLSDFKMLFFFPQLP